MSNELLKREVYVSWSEKIPPEEVVHQVEAGEPPPTRRRTGVVLQFINTHESFPSGRSDNKLQAVILDENIQQILMLPLTQLRVVAHAVAKPDRMLDKAVVGRLVKEAA